MSDLRQALGEVVREASLLWSPLPVGRFEAERAAALVERTIAWLVAVDPLLEPGLPLPEQPEIIARRELEMKAARERCAVTLGGHLWYAGRSSCARCFEPKPVGWEG